MKMAHGPVFINAEAIPIDLLTYSEHRFPDIHGNSRGAHCEGNVLYFGEREFMTDNFREVLFLFLAD